MDGNVTIPVDEYNRLRDAFENYNKGMLRVVMGQWGYPENRYRGAQVGRPEWLEYGVYYLGKDEAIIEITKELEFTREELKKIRNAKIEATPRAETIVFTGKPVEASFGSRVRFLFTGRVE